MAGTKYNTWDGDPANSVNPHRPSGADCGGTDLEDDIEDPPPEDVPGADGWNQHGKQIEGIAKVTTSARIEVRFNAGAPSIYRIQGPRTSLLTTDLQIFDDGTGVTRLKDNNNKLPARQMGPGNVTILSDAVAAGGAETGKAYEVAANEIRIRTYAGTTPTDLNFRVDWD